ncbi:dienelactone hydrolase family protein [Telmatospirillum sp.]|uniref:dienelactone hydrolase family protein n=1 Tax=Telmatospirillum sp. TaxID=2079197 RepID=UPI002840C844|nr:dienelactone hydrolase family protein [Telmatospirillum sp.]MDR3435612.1 dienelactone hydrolase family protein [Telmatospirillum sp.]
MGKVALICAGLMASAIAPQLARGAETEVREMVLPTTEGAVSAKLFTIPGSAEQQGAARPAVIILHGTQGIGRFRSFYENFAGVIAAAGIDAYLFSYYSDVDAVQMKSPDAGVRREVFNNRVRAWSSRVSDVISDIRANGHQSRPIGVVGFSLGGFLGTAVAAHDERVTALTVFYGGIPTAVKDEIAHLPPLLELHGDADRRVPLTEGRALADFARGLGQSVEMVVYPGAEHGFAGKDEKDAEGRTVAFFRQQLSAPVR